MLVLAVHRGDVLSPILWCLVIALLLEALKSLNLFCIGYADDVIVVRGKFINTASSIMTKGLRCVERWCFIEGLSVNPRDSRTAPIWNTGYKCIYLTFFCAKSTFSIFNDCAKTDFRAPISIIKLWNLLLASKYFVLNEISKLNVIKQVP